MGKKPDQFLMDKVDYVKDLKELVAYGKKRYNQRYYYTYKKNQQIYNITYDRFGTIIEEFGTAMSKSGFMGSTVALLSETRYEWNVTYLSVVNGNGVIVPLDKEIASEQILNFVERSGADCIVYSASYQELIENYGRKNPGAKLKFFVNMDYTREEAENVEGIKVVSFEEMLSEGAASLAKGDKSFTDVVIDRTKMCSCLFTSGTTGTSKAVMLSHRNISSVAYHAACDVNLLEGDTILSVLPAHHTYETSCTFFATWLLGVNIIANDSLKMVMKNFQFYKPTKMVLVPIFMDTIVKKIWDEVEKKGKTKTVKTAIKMSNALRAVGIDLRRKLFKDILNAFGGNVNGIVCGGAPLNPEHIRTFDNIGIKVWQGYGITECAPLVSIIPEDMCMKKIGSVGYPTLGNEVKINEPDDKGIGEIWVRGENVMLGYLNNEEATREVLTPDGFFKTGDLGYLDKDGYLFITGRKKNVIILSNGKNIYPEEIEEYLHSINLIAECAVISRKADNVSDGVLVALIYPDFDKFKNADGTQKPISEIEAEIKKAIITMNKQLPTYKQINTVEVRQTEFEKTTTKKIIRYKLK